MPEKVNNGHWADDFGGDYGPGMVQDLGGCLVVLLVGGVGLVAGAVAIVAGAVLLL